MSRPETISKLSFYLMDKEPLIYLFIINSDFIYAKDEEIGGLAGVTYKDGRVQFYYGDMFINLPIEELYFVLIHEAQHIFKNHIKMYKEHKNKKILNIAQDAIINNEIIATKFLGIEPKMPSLGGSVIPDKFKRDYSSMGEDAYTSARLYNWYLEKKEELSKLSKKEFLLKVKSCKNTVTGEYGLVLSDSIDPDKLEIGVFDSKKEMLDSRHQWRYRRSELTHIDDLMPVISRGGEEGASEAAEPDFEVEIDDPFDSIVKEEGGEEEIIPQQIFIENIVKQAVEMEDNNEALKQAKLTAGIGSENSLIDAVKKILVSQINWKKEFKQKLNLYMSDRGSVKGTKKSYITYMLNPRSRYGIIGKHDLKTTIKKQNYLIMAVDTSGSCFYDNFDKERFFTEIDEIAREMKFSGTGKVFILMWDGYVSSNDIVEYNVGDWKNFKLTGGGGTNPHSVFDYLERRLDGNVLKLNDKESIYIESLTKLPFLLFLTDGWFFFKLEKKSTGIYQKDLESLMFMTREERYIDESISRVIYK